MPTESGVFIIRCSRCNRRVGSLVGTKKEADLIAAQEKPCPACHDVNAYVSEN
jgi:phage FluMu protein Com